jgi:dUTP pyrophosphatase
MGVESVVSAFWVGVMVGIAGLVTLQILSRQDSVKVDVGGTAGWTLEVVADHEEARAYYGGFTAKYQGDACIDLKTFRSVTVLPGVAPTLVPYDVRAALYDRDGRPASYILVGRSSLSRTPLALASNPAIMDAGYRGPLDSLVRIIPGFADAPIEIPAGTQLAQLCSADLRPIHIRLVDKLRLHGVHTPSGRERDEHRFGSSGGTLPVPNVGVLQVLSSHQTAARHNLARKMQDVIEDIDSSFTADDTVPLSPVPEHVRTLLNEK